MNYRIPRMPFVTRESAPALYREEEALTRQLLRTANAAAPVLNLPSQDEPGFYSLTLPEVVAQLLDSVDRKASAVAAFGVANRYHRFAAHCWPCYGMKDDLEIIAVAPTADLHLNVVLCVRYNSELRPEEFVTWLHNRNDYGFHHGNYFPVREAAQVREVYSAALRDFAERVQEKSASV